MTATLGLVMGIIGTCCCVVLIGSSLLAINYAEKVNDARIAVLEPTRQAVRCFDAGPRCDAIL